MRNYNDECQDNDERKYVYDFDFDVMHKYILKYCMEYKVAGSCLELGSFEGEFTKRLIYEFDDITCVEAASNAISCARDKLANAVKFVEGTFQEITLPEKYDNIFITHVLEHIENRVQLLQKIKEQWLNPQGRLFIVCPNANAASRQIAVHMGLISNNTAITDGERAQGHYVTHTLDTLASEAKKAGLAVEQYGGIFFKALANFQWDQVINQGIVSEEYLDACYELGKKYPDLCSSIVLVCR